jgi:hypothetical protein
MVNGVRSVTARWARPRGSSCGSRNTPLPEPDVLRRDVEVAGQAVELVKGRRHGVHAQPRPLLEEPPGVEDGEPGADVKGGRATAEAAKTSSTSRSRCATELLCWTRNAGDAAPANAHPRTARRLGSHLPAPLSRWGQDLAVADRKACMNRPWAWSGAPSRGVTGHQVKAW